VESAHTWVGPYPAKRTSTATYGPPNVHGPDPAARSPDGQFVEYMLPTVNANIRHIDVDNSSSSNPIAVWVAEVHQGKIAKLNRLTKPWKGFVASACRPTLSMRANPRLKASATKGQARLQRGLLLRVNLPAAGSHRRRSA